MENLGALKWKLRKSLIKENGKLNYMSEPKTNKAFQLNEEGKELLEKYQKLKEMASALSFDIDPIYSESPDMTPAEIVEDLEKMFATGPIITEQSLHDYVSSTGHSVENWEDIENNLMKYLEPYEEPIYVIYDLDIEDDEDNDEDVVVARGTKEEIANYLVETLLSEGRFRDIRIKLAKDFDKGK